MKPKFKYEGHHIVFFFDFKGKQIEVLRARLQDGTLTELKRLQTLATLSMNELYAALKRAA